MLLILGTSLSVQPFSTLIHQVRENVPRVLINNEAVGPFRFCNLSCCFRDVMIEGDCDEGVKSLCKELGWEEELESLYRKDHPLPEVGDPSALLEEDDPSALLEEDDPSALLEEDGNENGDVRRRK